MQIKTFRGKTSSEVMARIKKEVGPDAVILSSENITENGQKWYEVVVALEREVEGDIKHQIPDKSNFDLDFRLEWEKFKKSIYDLVKPQLNKENITPRQRQVLDFLEKQGAGTDLILDLYSKMRQSSNTPVLKILGQAIKITPWTDKFTSRRIHAFAGPSGSGQTTTLLRLALEMKRSSKKILVLNANKDQAGGRLYLKHFAELSGLVYLEGDTLDQNSLEKFNSYDYIFIDLPGISPGKTLSACLTELKVARDVAIHLVFSPSYSNEHFDLFVCKYSHPQAQSLIWTKLDEGCIFGPIINLAWKMDLPISYLSYGPGLKNYSTSATQDNVWRLIFKKELPNECKVLNYK
ncbi:flagellar biosynthesis protein FlhF [Desulfovulcanus sp.]